jgi:hypothetical protein
MFLTNLSTAIFFINCAKAEPTISTSKNSIFIAIDYNGKNASKQEIK